MAPKRLSRQLATTLHYARSFGSLSLSLAKLLPPLLLLANSVMASPVGAPNLTYTSSLRLSLAHKFSAKASKVQTTPVQTGACSFGFRSTEGQANDDDELQYDVGAPIGLATRLDSTRSDSGEQALAALVVWAAHYVERRRTRTNKAGDRSDVCPLAGASIEPTRTRAECAANQGQRP